MEQITTQNPTCPECQKPTQGPFNNRLVDGETGVEIYRCTTCTVECDWDDKCHPNLEFYIDDGKKVVVSCGSSEHA